MHGSSVWTIVYNTTLDKYLVAQRAPTITNPNIWNFFGGGVKEKEQPINAAVRELKEESGISVRPSELQSLGSIKLNSNYIFYYLYSTSIMLPFTLNGESATAKWLSKGEIAKLSLHFPTKIFMQRQKSAYPTILPGERITFHENIQSSTMTVVACTNAYDNKQVENFVVASALVHENQLLHIATDKDCRNKSYGSILLNHLVAHPYGKVDNSIDYAGRGLIPTNAFVGASDINAAAVDKQKVLAFFQKNSFVEKPAYLSCANPYAEDATFVSYVKPISSFYPNKKQDAFRYEAASVTDSINDKKFVKVYSSGKYIGTGTLTNSDHESSWVKLTLPLHNNIYLPRDYCLEDRTSHLVMSVTDQQFSEMCED